jgi:hypothetical protein
VDTQDMFSQGVQMHSRMHQWQILCVSPAAEHILTVAPEQQLPQQRTAVALCVEAGCGSCA